MDLELLTILGGAGATIGLATTIGNTYIKYKSDSQLYNEWNELALTTESPALQKYITIKQDHLGKPLLKNYLTSIIKPSITKDYQGTHFDIQWKKNMVEHGVYDAKDDGLLIKAREEIAKEVKEN